MENVDYKREIAFLVIFSPRPIKYKNTSSFSYWYFLLFNFYYCRYYRI